MTQPYSLSDRIGSRATLGLIALQTDETIEQEFRHVFNAEDVALYVSRVPSGADVTPDSLAMMEQELPRAASLLPPSLDYHAVGYACTSGATIIGPERVGDLVRGAADAKAVTNPLSAVLAGLSALGVGRIGLVTPYIESVTAPMRAVLDATGYQVAASVSFEEAEEAKVARIDPRSIADAARAAAQRGVEAVFLSCTNLRTFGIIDALEAELGIAIISSNQALGWHMARLAGLGERLGPGRLWDLP
ncbi:MAG: aspartate/glutamate racemase family protein [Rhodobacter sp.]|nr:aspartate/glutamate racemase family protein [Rhodobacter sp.]